MDFQPFRLVCFYFWWRVVGEKLVGLDFLLGTLFWVMRGSPRLDDDL